MSNAELKQIALRAVDLRLHALESGYDVCLLQAQQALYNPENQAEIFETGEHLRCAAKALQQLRDARLYLVLNLPKEDDEI